MYGAGEGLGEAGSSSRSWRGSCLDRAEAQALVGGRGPASPRGPGRTTSARACEGPVGPAQSEVLWGHGQVGKGRKGDIWCTSSVIRCQILTHEATRVQDKQPSTEKKTDGSWSQAPRAENPNGPLLPLLCLPSTPPAAGVWGVRPPQHLSLETQSSKLLNGLCLQGRGQRAANPGGGGGQTVNGEREPSPRQQFTAFASGQIKTALQRYFGQTMKGNLHLQEIGCGRLRWEGSPSHSQQSLGAQVLSLSQRTPQKSSPHCTHPRIPSDPQNTENPQAWIRGPSRVRVSRVPESWRTDSGTTTSPDQNPSQRATKSWLRRGAQMPRELTQEKEQTPRGHGRRSLTAVHHRNSENPRMTLRWVQPCPRDTRSGPNSRACEHDLVQVVRVSPNPTRRRDLLAQTQGGGRATREAERGVTRPSPGPPGTFRDSSSWKRLGGPSPGVLAGAEPWTPGPRTSGLRDGEGRFLRFEASPGLVLSSGGHGSEYGP